MKHEIRNQGSSEHNKEPKPKQSNCTLAIQYKYNGILNQSKPTDNTSNYISFPKSIAYQRHWYFNRFLVSFNRKEMINLFQLCSNLSCISFLRNQKSISTHVLKLACKIFHYKTECCATKEVFARCKILRSFFKINQC
jgi:hypothetical protein